MKTLRPKEREADIQKTILEGLSALRIYSFRLNTSALRVGSRFVRAHSLGPGAADIVAFPQKLRVPNGSSQWMVWLDGAPAVIWIECKSPIGQQTPEQKNFQAAVEQKGMKYVLARSWEDVLEALK